ncbi:MAG: hypothetical protein ABIS86_05035 [Streptosporangiaceae bacterium]
MTGAGREPVDLASLHAADALFDRLAARTLDAPGENDAAIGLLRALLEDVDGRPEVRVAAPAPRSGNRRAARTTAALGVAAAVLATTGVTAAAGGWIEPGTERAPTHSSKPVTKKPAGKRENTARRLPVARVTQPRPVPEPVPRPALGPVPVPVPAPVARSQAPGQYDLGSEDGRPAEDQDVAEIRGFVRSRLHDGTWR